MDTIQLVYLLLVLAFSAGVGWLEGDRHGRRIGRAEEKAWADVLHYWTCLHEQNVKALKKSAIMSEIRMAARGVAPWPLRPQNGMTVAQRQARRVERFRECLHNVGGLGAAW